MTQDTKVDGGIMGHYIKALHWPVSSALGIHGEYTILLYCIVLYYCNKAQNFCLEIKYILHKVIPYFVMLLA